MNKLTLVIIITILSTLAIFNIDQRPRDEHFYFDGITFKDPKMLFDYIDRGGFEKSTYRMEFAYEDYLVTLPQELLRYRENLEILGVVHGRVESVPGWIGEFQNLSFLQVANQKIKTLPPEIGQLTNLKELRLEGNDIASLPPEIGQLQKLEMLLLQNNSLAFLPKEIGNLENLEVLDLSSNNLASLPEEIENIKSLEVLYLGGNNLSMEEKEKIKKLLPNTKICF